jgi:protein gp37
MPTNIQWTDETWNCVRGCSRVSAGCGDSTGGGCYAERQAYRFSGPGMPYEGLVRMTPKGPRWTGKVILVPEKLEEPLHWRKPRRIFVNSMSDLFHESLSFGQIFRVLMVMQQCPQHEFQVLTKRPARMKEFFEWLNVWGTVTALAMGFSEYYEWPYPNVWLGISCEDQNSFDERWPYLRDTPTWTRWLSLEPLLGPINARPALIEDHYYCDISLDPDDPPPAHRCSSPANWVVVGGESGPKARSMDLEWARSVVAQCKAASVPVFVKQLGRHPVDEGIGAFGDGADEWKFVDKKGGDINEWPQDLRVREYPVSA